MAGWAGGHFGLIFILLKTVIIYGQKEVHISVQFANVSVVETLTFAEGTLAHISCPLGTLILIEDATYGVPGGQSSYSVTPFVKEPCHGNTSCSFRVTSQILSMPWLMQNKTKVLNIRYSCERVYQLCHPVTQNITSQRGFVTLGDSPGRFCSITIATKNSVAVMLEKLSKTPQFYEIVLCDNTLVIGVRKDLKCPPIMNPSQVLPSARLPPNLTMELHIDLLENKELFLAFKGVEPVVRRFHPVEEQTTDVSISSAPAVQRKGLFPDWLPIALGVGASFLLLLALFLTAVFIIRPRCRQGNFRGPSCCRSKELEYMEVATGKNVVSTRGRHNGHVMNMMTDSIYQDDIYEKIDINLRRSELDESKYQTIRSLNSDEGIGSTMSSTSSPTGVSTVSSDVGVTHTKTCREPRSSLPPVPCFGSPHLPVGSNMAALPVNTHVEIQDHPPDHKYDNADSLLTPDDLGDDLESDLDSVSSDLEIIDNEIYSQCRPLKRSRTKQTKNT